MERVREIKMERASERERERERKRIRENHEWIEKKERQR